MRMKCSLASPTPFPVCYIGDSSPEPPKEPLPMIIETRQLTSILASLILAVLVAGREARADILITIEQSGNNVVETGSGAANTTGLTLEFTVGQGALIIPGLAIAVVGEVDSAATIFSGATGPASFGTSSNPVDPTSGTGDTFGIEGNSGVLALPAGYVSGTQLSGSTTFAGTNFTQMALTAGTYTYTWGTGSDQSLTVQIGPAASAVPEPSTAISAVVGAIAFVTYGWIVHRRQQRRQVSA